MRKTLLVCSALFASLPLCLAADQNENVFSATLPLIPPAELAPASLQLKTGDSIVSIGDSITAQGGYLDDINAVLGEQYPDLKIPKVINRGVDGQRSEQLINRFANDVVALKPAFVTISIGINDVWHRLKNPPDENVLVSYKKNIATMVDLSQAAGIKVILLAPTIIQEDPQSEGNVRLTKYVEAMKQVAADKKCQFVDLHGLFLAALAKKPVGETGNWLTVDGVHMRPLGNAIMAVGVLRALGVPDKKIAATNVQSPQPRPAMEPAKQVQPAKQGSSAESH